MLSSLLPGLREVRAPVAAGFAWLVALWFLVEPVWDRDPSADRVVGSANRLMDTLSLVGQGAVLSFLAYLVGSFSVFLFSGPLLSLIRVSTDSDARPLAGLSDLGRVSLTQVAADGRQRLEGALALSGVGVDEVLGLVAPLPDMPDKRAPRRSAGQQPAVLSSTTVLPTPEERQEREIAARVLRDLPVVANAQLLGHEPEVFAAVDRSQAEVEFRGALVPALLALAVAVAVVTVPQVAWAGVLAVVLGVLAAVGLMLDAARARRDSNELILSLMEHGRITAPSVLRAESAALALADQAPAKVVGRQAEATTRAIRQYLASLDAVPSSGSLPMLTQAHDAAARARDEARRLDHLLHLYASGDREWRVAEEVLDPLDRALSGWTALNAALSLEPQVPEVDWPTGGPTPDELVQLIVEGRQRNRDLIDQVRAAVADIATRDTARGTAPGDP